MTAFAVLQPGIIVYKFGCNERTISQLKEVKIYLTEILTTLKNAPDEDIRRAVKNSRETLYCDILRKIVVFNRPRIESYSRMLATQIGFCIDETEHDNSNEGQSALGKLNALKLLAGFARKRNTARIEQHEDDSDDLDSHGSMKMPENEYAGHVEALLRLVDEFHANGLDEFIADKCQADRAGPAKTHWNEVNHALGRLLSYFLAVKVLISASKFWPELFADFAVVPIRSSRPDHKPPAIRRSADTIIPRMTNNTALIDNYQRHAEGWQQWGLDKKIAEETEPGKFKPIVHAEVLVDDSVRREQRTNVARGEERIQFFRESEFGAYIGTSKPPCRLCGLWFQEHPHRVQVRPSHNNLYHNWKAPDVFQGDGHEVVAQRDATLERIVVAVRGDAFAAITKRTAIHRPFDSSTTPSNIPPIFGTDRSSSIVAVDGLDEVVSMMGEVRLGSERGRAERRGSFETTGQAGRRAWTQGLLTARRQVLAEDDEVDEVDDQDDGGGAAL